MAVTGPVAQLIGAAQAVADGVGGTSLLFAPSAADSEVRTRIVTHFDEEFAAALLDVLQAAAIQVGPRVAWAHHNYSDLERRWDTTYLQQLRDVLRGRRTGFEEGEPPTVFVTEGGARLSKMRALYPAEDPLAAQAESLRQGWDRHVRDDGPGAGVAMLAQYQTYSAPALRHRAARPVAAPRCAARPTTCGPPSPASSAAPPAAAGGSQPCQGVSRLR